MKTCQKPSIHWENSRRAPEPETVVETRTRSPNLRLELWRILHDTAERCHTWHAAPERRPCSKRGRVAPPTTGGFLAERPRPTVVRRATRYRRAACLAIATSVALIAVYGLPVTPAHAQSTKIYATSFGAVCKGILLPSSTGTSVDGAAIQAAIDAAEARTGGATVVLPAGVCVIAQALVLGSGSGITLEGTIAPTGAPLTTLTDPINPQSEGGDLSIGSNGNTIEDLIMDQSHYGGVVYDHANHTTFERTTMLGGPVSFAVFFAEQSDGRKAEGNKLIDSTVVSLINRLVLGGTQACDDGLVWANQDHSLIQNLTFTGTRLALYQDTNATVNGYTYYPGPQTCDLDGYYITQPSSDIGMSNLTMYGSGGVISNGGTVDGISTGISISNEIVLPPTPGYGFALAGPQPRPRDPQRPRRHHHEQ